MEMTTANAKNRFSEVVNRAAFAKERVTLTRRGKPVAAVVSVEDLEKLERLENQADLEEARLELKKFKRNKETGIPLEDVARELGIQLPK